MKFFNKAIFSVSLSLLGTGIAQAEGAGSTGGLALIEPSSARSAALGEAFTAMTNDIGAFSYNPATLEWLRIRPSVFYV